VRGTRRREKYSKKRKSQDTAQSNASVTFSALMRRLDANSAQAPEPSPKLSMVIEQTVTRSPPQRMSLSSFSEWWIRRKEKRASQLYNHSSHRPSVIDGDVKRLEEETQWTLGKDLEEQRRHVFTPPPFNSLQPVSQPNSPRRHMRVPTRGPSLKSSRWSRGGRSILESEGGDFTLEDAFSSLGVVYELGSSRSGRHPYARA
jgi:hypothetical protein